MTTEIRQIAFQPVEVCAALQDYCRRRNEPLPQGSIANVDFGTVPEVTVTLKIHSDTTGQAQEVSFTAEKVAAALILYCINRKIPLPAKAAKKVQHIGDTIGLWMKQELGGKHL